MEFIEGSRGIYRPIRVLFDTPIYDRALQLCWYTNSYHSQIALLRELLMLQEAYQIPPQVTAEDMINLIMEESRGTLRERLWEFELEDFDEEEAKPLLMLVWAVNVSNKMRDIEFEAQMLLNSSEPVPPKFLHPKVLSVAMEYAKVLRTRQEAPSSKLLSPQEVVLEVVPRVLQGFWTLPRRSLLNMPSQKLSKMSVGVTKAVLDRVTDALTGVEGQTTFSRSIRDNVVQSILTHIRQTHPLDILVNRIKSFAPELLSEIVDVAAEKICEMFQPQSSKVPAHLSPAAEPPAAAPVQEVQSSPETNPAVVSLASSAPSSEPLSTADAETREAESDKPSLENNPEPTREPDSAAVSVSPAPPVEPPSTTDVETREDESDKSGHENDFKPIRDPDSAVVPPALTPPVEPPSITDVETRKDKCDKPSLENNTELVREPDSDAVPAAPAPPVKPPSTTDDETREDESDESGLENDSEPTRDSNSAVVPPTMTPPAVPPSITDVEARKDESDKSCFENREATREPDCAAVLPSLTPPAEPPRIPVVLAKQEENKKPCLEENLISTRAPVSAATPAPLASLTPPAEPEIITAAQENLTTSPAVTAPIEPPQITEVQDREPVPPAPWSPLTPPLEPVVIVSVSEVKDKRAQGFFSWLVQPVCSCFGVGDALTELLSFTVKLMCKLINK